MPTSCCAIGCSNRHKKAAGIKFIRLPGLDKPEKRSKWLRALRRGVYGASSTKEWEPKGHERVCSAHFLSGNTSDDPLDPDYVPSIFSFTSLVSAPSNLSKDRYLRAKKRRKLEPCSESVIDSENVDPQFHSQSQPVQEEQQVRVSPDGGLEDELEKLRAENSLLREKNVDLQRHLASSKQESDRLNDRLKRCQVNAETLTDKKCRFYTGIPNVALFVFIVGLVSEFIVNVKSISKADQILLTMMKLRQGLKNVDLGYSFGISSTTVSKVINNCIPALAARLRFLIHWPTREEVIKNLPKKFKRKYGNCRVIIDCSEIFTERPYNLKARAKTWSNYKHHHTMKFLVGITPYGTVSFLSQCWGGRISNVEVTSRSGFYDKIEYGDMVMADRGFTISQELAMRGATLVIPPFIAGRKQLPGRVVQNARQISCLRIHVERAIERIKNFKILKEIIPLSLSPLASDIVEICSAVTNLMPRLIK